MGHDGTGGWRERAAGVRSLPLEGVAARLGYRQDVADPTRWMQEGSVLSLTGAKFYDHYRQCGGGGAIDLVMQARGCGFRAAVDFLSLIVAPSRVPPGSNDRGGSAQRQPSTLQLPLRSDASWPRVRDYLVVERGLGPALVASCHRHGLVYADDRRNAVFVCRTSSGAVTGAEIVGTVRWSRRNRMFKGMAPGSRKALGGFWMSWGSMPPVAMLLTESAVDALSVLSLTVTPAPLTLGFATASTAGVSTTVPRWLDGCDLQRIYCGYDADRAGDEAAAVLCRQNGRISRVRPAVDGEDWNDLLLRERAGKPV